MRGDLELNHSHHRVGMGHLGEEEGERKGGEGGMDKRQRFPLGGYPVVMMPSMLKEMAWKNQRSGWLLER